MRRTRPLGLAVVAILGVISTELPAQNTIPLVFGTQAAWLRPADVEGITRAVASYGGPPWLITEVRRSPRDRNGQFQWSALAYAAPTTATTEFRRGALVRVTAGPTTEQLADAATWRVDASTVRQWAQVAIPGRRFDDVKGEQDENLPLTISGDITDADLLSAVRFLRSGPVIAVPAGLRLGQVPGPVRGIRGPAIRHPALPGVRVVIGRSAGCTYDIVLERRGDTWIGEVQGGVGCASGLTSNPDVAPRR
jgi:hypothetical protein